MQGDVVPSLIREDAAGLGNGALAPTTPEAVLESPGAALLRSWLRPQLWRLEPVPTQRSHRDERPPPRTLLTATRKKPAREEDPAQINTVNTNQKKTKS